jgi:hypothetical protein
LSARQCHRRPASRCGTVKEEDGEFGPASGQHCRAQADEPDRNLSGPSVYVRFIFARFRASLTLWQAS